MSSTTRLLQLLSLLQTRRDWPGQVLAERLEISHRTLRRDVDRLREMGYRIHATKGPDGGYRLDAGSDLPPLLFDDDQAVAIAVALGAATVAGAGIEEAAVRALTTVRQVMPSRLRHRLDGLRFTAMPHRADAGVADVSPDTLVALSTAIGAREVLRFEYGDTLRRVEPHHLVTADARWYLVAWDLERDGWRLYRVDRMTLRTPTGPRFERRTVPGGDIRAYVTSRFRGSAGAEPGWPCVGKVVLHLSAEAVRPFAGEGIVEPLDENRCTYEVGSWSWRALAASLGRFDAEIEVMHPPELAQAFADLAARYSRAAAASPIEPASRPLGNLED